MIPAWLDRAWLEDFYWTYQNVVTALGVNGLLALSMYVVLAVGQLSLGQAAFMGLGAYSSAIMTANSGVGSELTARARMSSSEEESARSLAACTWPAASISISPSGGTPSREPRTLPATGPAHP